MSSPSHPKRLTGVTTPAILEIQVAAEGALATVTGCAGVVSGGEVFLSARRADLAPLWQAGGVIVTVVTAEPLARAVLRMAEGEAKSGRVSWGPGVSLLIVTDAARGDVPSLRLRVGRVTFIALVMR